MKGFNLGKILLPGKIANTKVIGVFINKVPNITIVLINSRYKSAHTGVLQDNYRYESAHTGVLHIIRECR